MAIAFGIFSCSNDAEIMNEFEILDEVSVDAKSLKVGNSI